MFWTIGVSIFLVCEL